MDDDLFREESYFYCSICGSKLESNDEIDEEICHDCLACMLLEEKELTPNLTVF